MPLPSSGIISGSQIGVYVFDRSPTAIFSLSASLASPGNSTKAYATTLGPLWRGEGLGDTNNPQYDETAPWSISDWYSYFKGVLIEASAGYRNDPDTACADTVESTGFYATDGVYWGGNSETEIINNQTVGYTDTEGATPVAETEDYYKIFSMNAAYQFDADGKFVNEYPCP